MSWLQSLDLSILRFVRETLHNSLFDWLMPFLSGNGLFAPVVAVAAVLLAWKGGARGRLCLLMVGLVVFAGDALICSSLKEAIRRARPSGFNVVAELQVPLGHPSSYSMPSSHAANWFAAMIVCFLYYRRSLWFMLPIALAVSYSRIYKGAHYPTDVLAGAVLGSAFAFGAVMMLDRLWQFAGRRWFPLWWNRLPSLVNIPEEAAGPAEGRARCPQRAAEHDQSTD